MGSRKGSENLWVALKAWFKSQSVKKQACQALAIICFLVTLISLTFGDYWAAVLYFTANFIRVCGISALVYKLTRKKTCSGLSLKSQELTAICLAVSLYLHWSGNVYTTNVYTIASGTLDLFGLITTIWVIYIIRFKLRSTYMENVDNLPIYYLLVPCALLALVTHPLSNYVSPLSPLNKAIVAFVPYLESVQVLPQLRVMQSERVVEAFTAFYVFALGAERLFKFTYFFTVILKGIMDGYITTYFDFGLFLFIVSEIVQSFILADFVYYYLKIVSTGPMLMHLPTIWIEQSPV